MTANSRFNGMLAVPIWRLKPYADLAAALLGESKENAALARASEIAARLPELRKHYSVGDDDPHWLLILVARMGAEIGIPAFKEPRKKGRKATRSQAEAIRARLELLSSIERWIAEKKLQNAGTIWRMLDHPTPSVRKEARARLPEYFQSKKMQTIRADYNAAKKERAEFSKPTPEAPSFLSGGLSGGLFGLGAHGGLLGNVAKDEN